VTAQVVQFLDGKGEKDGGMPSAPSKDDISF